MFDSEGHLQLSALLFRDMLKEKPAREIVNNYLMVGTPRAFETYEQYCSFTRELGKVLGVHCRSFIVRGSAHLGYSISPKPDKVWRAFGVRADGKLSDIDIAIVDAD